MIRSFFLTLLLAVCAFAVGCGDKTKSAENGGDNGGNEPAARGIQAAVLDYDVLKSLIDSKRGKIVVLDCWATWCDPCKKELPGLGELVKKHGSEVAGITVSVDFSGTSNETPEQHRAEVEKFLNTLPAEFQTMDHVISRLPFDESPKHEALKLKLGFEKGAVVPTVIVFDREGTAVRRFDSGMAEFTYAKDVAPFVAEMIGEQ